MAEGLVLDGVGGNAPLLPSAQQLLQFGGNRVCDLFSTDLRCASFSTRGLGEKAVPARKVDVGSLLLDLENPRISRAGSQDDALQKILEDQDVKLLALAQSIVEDGLNPMDRLLVITGPDRGKHTVIEGNRRLAALTILRDPSVMDRIEVRPNLQRRLATLAREFDNSSIQKLDVWLVPDRVSASSWIRQRHTGENQGRGIVDWNGVARARFRGTDPALQALDLVLQHGQLTDEEKADIEDRFPITTLDRLIRTPDVRKIIGVDIAGDKLLTDLPAPEVIKPLLRIVRDLSNGTVNVTQLKKKSQQVDYAKNLGVDLPDKTKRTGIPVRVEALTDKDFGKGKSKAKPAPKPKRAAARKTLIPSDCTLNVSNPKIREIEGELRNLPLLSFPHAIAVLFRVFLEQSTDHYLTKNRIPLVNASKGGGSNPKSLRTKVQEAVAHMIAAGVSRNALDGVSKGINDKNSPLNIDTLNNYVHNAFYSPQERELKVSWDNSRIYFEKIWT